MRRPAKETRHGWPVFRGRPNHIALPPQFEH
jgi:hypothetical protein